MFLLGEDDTAYASSKYFKLNVHQFCMDEYYLLCNEALPVLNLIRSNKTVSLTSSPWFVPLSWQNCCIRTMTCKPSKLGQTGLVLV